MNKPEECEEGTMGEAEGTNSVTGGVKPPLTLEQQLLQVSRSSVQEVVSGFYQRVDTSMKRDYKNVEELLDMLLQEENETVIKFYVLLMQNYMRFRKWMYWMGIGPRGNNSSSPISETLMMRMKNPVNVNRILHMLKIADKKKLGWKELLGDLLVCMSMPKRFRNGAEVHFNEDHEVWTYAVESLQTKERWIDGLILCNCFLKKSHEDPEILDMFSITCNFLPQLPNHVASILISDNNKTSDEIELAITCLFGLAQLGSSSSAWYRYPAFFRTMSTAVKQLNEKENYEELQAISNGLSKTLGNTHFTALFRHFSVSMKLFLELALKPTLEAEFRVAALNVVITGFTGFAKEEINRISWKSHLVTCICELIVKETNIPADLSYFDVASWKDGENCIFTSSIRLLELMTEKIRTDTFFELVMPEVEKYIHDACYKSKFAAYVILGVAIGAGNMHYLSVSPHCRIWTMALELGAFDCVPPSAKVAGLIFAINESCKRQEIISVANSITWMLDSLRTFLKHLLSCIQITPGDASLRRVTMQTLDSLAAAVGNLDFEDDTMWKAIIGPLLSEIRCNKLCHLIKQTALYGIFTMVEKCGHLAVRDYQQICEDLMEYMTTVEEGNDFKCKSDWHSTSCVAYEKSQLYIVCIDIIQSLLLSVNTTNYAFFQPISDKILVLYHTFSDPDLHTIILKYFSNLCVKFGSSLNSKVIESILKCGIQSLETDDGFVAFNMCNYDYSKYFASEWKKFTQGGPEIQCWEKHIRNIPEKLISMEIPYPYHTERIQSIKLIQALCYNIGKRFHSYLNSAIRILTQAVHDSCIPVRIQALESLSNFICYKHKAMNARCSKKISSTMMLALEFIRFDCCVELMTASMESIEMFLKYCKIPPMEPVLIWAAISNILQNNFDSVEDTSENEFRRILELRKLCINIIPQFAKTIPNEDFADLFLGDKMIEVFENILSPKWSMLPSNGNSNAILHLQIDTVGVIGEVMKYIGDFMSSYEALRLFNILDSTFKSENQLIRCNTMYSVGAMFFRCDRQFVWQHITDVSRRYVDSANSFQNPLSPREAANCLGALSIMTLAKTHMVDLVDVLQVTFLHLPLTEDLDEYDNIIPLLFMVLKSPVYKKQLERYFRQIIDVCFNIYSNSSLIGNAGTVELANFLETEIRKEFPEEDAWLD